MSQCYTCQHIVLANMKEDDKYICKLDYKEVPISSHHFCLLYKNRTTHRFEYEDTQNMINKIDYLERVSLGDMDSPEGCRVVRLPSNLEIMNKINEIIHYINKLKA